MGSKTAKSTQAITIPPEVLARYNAINARADTVTNRPFQKYTGEFVAPLTETQRAGMAATNAAAGIAQPYFGAATNQLMGAQAATQPYFNAAGQAYGAGLGQGQQYLGAATGYAQEGGQAVNASDLDSAAINKYMSPYLQNVLQGTAGLLNQQNQQQQSGQMGNAIRSGAFGGDRGGIAAANLNQQQNLANAKIYSDILNEGYNNALNTAVGQQAVGLGAAQANRAATQQTADRMAALGQQGFNQFSTTGERAQGLGKDVYGTGAATSAALAGLGAGAQDAALSGAAAQMTAGQVEQATKQAENTALYNQFLQEQSLPYQQLKLASDIALGTGTAQGSATTTEQPGGFFSDERLKENIKAVGKTFDGQTIHSYNYKGDPRTQIGLIAQEVQKHHPDAVGLAGGYKTVNYDKATEDAADRGHMAYGGLASAGGSVLPQDAGQGFASGGVAGFDPAMMQQLLAAQQAMYDPITKGNMYAGGPNAGGGLVPNTEFAPRQLITPAQLPRQATSAEQVNSIVSLGKNINEFGEDIGAWGDKEDDKKDDKEPKKALGGEIPYRSDMTGKGLDIPQEDSSSKKYELMTPGSLEKQESGLDKVGKIAKIAGTVASIFSDKRMKENIKEIGKLFDGQIVHSFNYKGDPRTQIGLIAQEVEDHRPHAVGLAGGMKTVDYHKATSGAARRGHFAMGGMPMDAGLMGAEMAGLNEADREPDFNLDPEDIISGGDPDTEFFMRDSFKQPESPAQAAGLGALEDKSADILNAYKPKAPINPRPTGLAPKASGLPKNIMQIARLIHAGEGTGQNPDSTAKGPYQMIDSTFAGQFRKQYPDRAMGMSDRDIIALKRSPEGAALSEAMGPKLIESNARVIERGGFEPDAGNVYLAHFLGPDTAVRVLRADPNAPIANYVTEGAIRANRPLQENPTVGGVINWARGSMAKQASRLSRASGGLAGRDGYADGSAVKYPGMVPLELFDTSDMPAEEPAPTAVAPNQEAPAGLAAGEMANSYPEQTITQSKLKPSVPSASTPALKASLPAPNASPRPNIYGLGAQEPVNYEGGRVPNYSYDYMTEPFFKGLKKGKASSIIPLLTGIAAMGTAPTRSLGVALATGLGAGAQSYSGLANERNKQLVQRQIGTARYADSVRALFEKELIPLGGGRFYYRGRELNQDQVDEMLKGAFQNESGVGLPQIPANAMPYVASKAPEPAKPVEVGGQPDMSSVAGIYAAAYKDPVVQEARGRKANATKQVANLQALQSDPQMQTNPNSFAAISSRLAAANATIADATGTMTSRLSEITGVPLASLNASQQTVFNETMEKASNLQDQKTSMRPTLQLFQALEKSGYKGGAAQSSWATVTDFVKNFGGLTDAQKDIIGSGADEVSRQKIMEVIGGPVFDPTQPGEALRWIKENFFTPRYLDLEAQIKTIKPFTQPTGAPQSSIGTSPPIVSPPAERPVTPAGSRPTYDKVDNVWRGRTLQDLMNDPAVPKGARIRYPDANGKLTVGMK
jgi:hypothetical protein